MGAITILISNNENSPIVNSANYFFNMFAGEERSVAWWGPCEQEQTGSKCSRGVQETGN